MKFTGFLFVIFGVTLILGVVFFTDNGILFSSKITKQTIPLSRITFPLPPLTNEPSLPAQSNTLPKETEKEMSNISYANNRTVTVPIPETAPDKSTVTPIPKKRMSQQTLYKIASNHVVNLFCELENKEVAIATGIIINDAGYILTNAHVAYTDHPKSCLIRRGSPAQNFAIAERVFIPDNFSPTSFLYDNIIKDVALWKITTFIGDNTITGLSTIEINPFYTPTLEAPLSTFSYPAELLGSEAIVRYLHLTFSETIVRAYDTFIIESAEGVGSQKGSSGGIIIDPFTGAFAGLIFAINDANTSKVSERHLFSLTPYAIDTAIRNGTGKSLEEFTAN